LFPTPVMMKPSTNTTVAAVECCLMISMNSCNSRRL
jgi:hypothetical protein